MDCLDSGLLHVSMSSDIEKRQGLTSQLESKRSWVLLRDIPRILSETRRKLTKILSEEPLTGKYKYNAVARNFICAFNITFIYKPSLFISVLLMQFDDRTNNSLVASRVSVSVTQYTVID